jgi:hypothetical protein
MFGVAGLVAAALQKYLIADIGYEIMFLLMACVLLATIVVLVTLYNPRNIWVLRQRDNGTPLLEKTK